MIIFTVVSVVRADASAVAGGTSVSDLQDRSAEGGASGAAAAQRRWVPVPRVSGRVTARDIGLVINTADPYSVEVGEYYARARKLA